MYKCQDSARLPFRQISLSALVVVLLVAGHASGARGGSEPRIQFRQAAATVYDYRIVQAFPHDRNAFTQGLIYLDGYLYESTGINGASSIRQVQLQTGAVTRKFPLDSRYFGEGLTAWGPNLIQLTLKSNTGFVYDAATFRMRQTFSYPGEGWGLTHDGSMLIMSDGTPVLRYLNPWTFGESGQLAVRDGQLPVSGLNELEYVRGEIFANIWQTDRIARIDPHSGLVTGWIELGGLLKGSASLAPGSVLNGIAYDALHDRLFVTGKRWPKLFEIKLIPRP